MLRGEWGVKNDLGSPMSLSFQDKPVALEVREECPELQGSGGALECCRMAPSSTGEMCDQAGLEHIAQQLQEEQTLKEFAGLK